MDVEVRGESTGCSLILSLTSLCDTFTRAIVRAWEEAGEEGVGEEKGVEWMTCVERHGSVFNR